MKNEFNIKGKALFTEHEADQIRKLIIQKVTASRNEQKGIRNKIRNFGFYFSDFSNKKGYTVQDFDDLINTGELRIGGKIKTVNEQIQKSLENKLQSVKIEQSVTESADVEKQLFEDERFSSIKDLDESFLQSTGFYCIKLKPNSKLPERYQSILDKRTHKFIYVGKAEGQTLKQRLAQELELKSPGTFFRSIGCVLNYDPIKGHLKGKANQNNFKFSTKDKLEIIEWLDKNIDLSIVKYSGDFSIESKLIRKYCPLLNDTHNPMKLQELKYDKDICRKIARG